MELKAVNIETSLDHLGQLHIDADLADEYSPDGRGDYAVLAYVPEYDEYEISDPFNGSWDVGDDCWKAIDAFCSIYNVSYKDREQIERTFARLLRAGTNSNRSRKITSTTHRKFTKYPRESQSAAKFANAEQRKDRESNVHE